jgi:ribosomal protein S18 acetylase RimI-like enzyme
LGRRIVQAFEHWAAQPGARRIVLGMLEENQKACIFWKNMGFKFIEKRSPAQSGNRNHVVNTVLHNLSEGYDD